jgi:hypothetical protein
MESLVLLVEMMLQYKGVHRVTQVAIICYDLQQGQHHAVFLASCKRGRYWEAVRV